MHNHNEKNSLMIWMMVLCCALPILLIVMFGAGGKALGTPTWFVVGGVAIMIVMHFVFMGRSHKHSDGHSNEEETITDEKDKDKKSIKNHTNRDCCH